mmetsp:Transcript_13312/g.31667  ORF Transcript_13312/g.31667 Transcript_13312/m.31667 type:complete len:233 (+) Transcript_13312:146-844(+)
MGGSCQGLRLGAGVIELGGVTLGQPRLLSLELFLFRPQARGLLPLERRALLELRPIIGADEGEEADEEEGEVDEEVEGGDERSLEVVGRSPHWVLARAERDPSEGADSEPEGGKIDGLSVVGAENGEEDRGEGEEQESESAREHGEDERPSSVQLCEAEEVEQKRRAEQGAESDGRCIHCSKEDDAVVHVELARHVDRPHQQRRHARARGLPCDQVHGSEDHADEQASNERR